MQLTCHEAAGVPHHDGLKPAVTHAMPAVVVKLHEMMRDDGTPLARDWLAASHHATTESCSKHAPTRRAACVAWRHPTCCAHAHGDATHDRRSCNCCQEACTAVVRARSGAASTLPRCAKAASTARAVTGCTPRCVTVSSRMLGAAPAGGGIGGCRPNRAPYLFSSTVLRSKASSKELRRLVAGLGAVAAASASWTAQASSSGVSGRTGACGRAADGNAAAAPPTSRAGERLPGVSDAASTDRKWAACSGTSGWRKLLPAAWCMVPPEADPSATNAGGGSVRTGQPVPAPDCRPAV